MDQFDGIVRWISHRRPGEPLTIVHLIQGRARRGAQREGLPAVLQLTVNRRHHCGIPTENPGPADPPFALQHRRILANHHKPARRHHRARRKRQRNPLTEITPGQILRLGPGIVQFNVFTVYRGIILIVVDFIDDDLLGMGSPKEEREQSRHAAHLGECEHSVTLPRKPGIKKERKCLIRQNPGSPYAT